MIDCEIVESTPGSATLVIYCWCFWHFSSHMNEFSCVNGVVCGAYEKFSG